MPFSNLTLSEARSAAGFSTLVNSEKPGFNSTSCFHGPFMFHILYDQLFVRTPMRADPAGSLCNALLFSIETSRPDQSLLLLIHIMTLPFVKLPSTDYITDAVKQVELPG